LTPGFLAKLVNEDWQIRECSNPNSEVIFRTNDESGLGHIRSPIKTNCC